jgi:hypothetical protein
MQKTFLSWAVVVSPPLAQRYQKFLRRFFQKAAAFFYPSDT